MLEVINVINPDRTLQEDLNEDEDDEIFNKIRVGTDRN